MPSPSLARPSSQRRLLPRALLCLSLALAMAAGPWWQQAFARGTKDIPAMAICSVGNAAGSAPAHLASGHCQLCCGSQAQHALPDSSVADAAAGISYPLSAPARAERSASLAPGAPRARAPPLA